MHGLLALTQGLLVVWGSGRKETQHFSCFAHYLRDTKDVLVVVVGGEGIGSAVYRKLHEFPPARVLCQRMALEGGGHIFIAFPVVVQDPHAWRGRMEGGTGEEQGQ